MHHQSIHYLEFPVSSFIFENSGQQISNQRGSKRRGNCFKRLLVLCTMISTIISIAMVTPALFLVFTLILAHHTYNSMIGSNFRLRGSSLPKKQGRDWEKTTRLCFNPGGNPLTRKHCRSRCRTSSSCSMFIPQSD